MSDKKLKYFKDCRKHIRTKVTKKCTEERISSLLLKDCASEIEDLKFLRDQLAKLNEDIGHVLCMEEKFNLDSELNKCDEYYDTISIQIKKIEDHEKSISANSNFELANQQITEVMPPISKLKLPELPMPTFSNAPGESLERFFVNFEHIINKCQLAELEKFMLLKKQLLDSPLTLIKSLQGNEQNYTEAKGLLLKAFANPTMQKFDSINRLCNLKFSPTGDIFHFIGEMRSLITLFATLSISAKDILQVFI